MKIILFCFLILASCTSQGDKATTVKPSFKVVYISRTGDKIMARSDDRWDYFVWVEDSTGNIKAIARH